GLVVVGPGAIFSPSVVLVGREREPTRDGVRNRSAQCAFQFYLVEVADRSIEVPVEFLGRALAHIVNQAACCISPEKGAPRTSQHLKTSHVEQPQAQASRCRAIALVYVY